MAESIFVLKNQSREESYKSLIPQLRNLLAGESDRIANMANIVAALNEVFNFFWVGFYRAEDGQLILGPFQGPVACTRIPFDKGVCGAAYSQKKPIIVKDVNMFEGHIACSAESKSEIVLPVFNEKNEVFAVLDIDSDLLDNFSKVDEKYLSEICKLLK